MPTDKVIDRFLTRLDVNVLRDAAAVLSITADRLERGQRVSVDALRLLNGPLAFVTGSIEAAATANEAKQAEHDEVRH